MTQSEPTVVLLGIDRLLALQLARILWRQGRSVVGYAVTPNSHYCRTRAVEWTAPIEEFLAEPVSCLSSIAEKSGQRPILIPCTDELVWWLSTNREQLAEHADFLLASSESLERLADKARFCKEAATDGFLLPETRVVANAHELDCAAQEMVFPIIVKPSRRSPEWMKTTNGAKVLKLDRGIDLTEQGGRLLKASPQLVLQHWIPGGDDCMYSVLVCFDREHEPAMPPLVARKLRQWPLETGVGSLAMQVDEPELVETTLRLLRSRHYVGTGSLQFKKDATSGAFLLIEMNTRFSLNFPLCEASGLEATHIHCLLAAGRSLPSMPRLARPGMKWICWKRDLAAAFTHWRRGSLSIAGWVRSLAGPKRSADVVLSDPLPTLLDLVRKLRLTSRG